MVEYKQYQEAADYLRPLIPQETKVAITLGSGLGQLADKIEEPRVIPYTDIPNFPKSTALGHKGNLIVGKLEGSPVIAMQGQMCIRDRQSPRPWQKSLAWVERHAN